MKISFRTVSFIAVILFFTCFVGWKPARAQETVSSDQSGPAASDLEVELQALEMTTPIPASKLPDGGAAGTYWSAQNVANWPPLPADVLGLSAWPLGDGVFVLDDTNV